MRTKIEQSLLIADGPYATPRFTLEKSAAGDRQTAGDRKPLSVVREPAGMPGGQVLQKMTDRLKPVAQEKFVAVSILLAALALPVFAQETVAATSTGSTPAQPISQPVKLIQLTTGRGELLQFSDDIKQVAAAEPKIADVIVIDPREVMVNAKEPGKTTVVIWDGVHGPMRYNVDVTADTAEQDNFKQEFAKELPGCEIEITGKGETVVLTGTAATEELSKKAAALAQTRAKTVVNLIKVTSPKEPKQVILKVVFASIDRTVLKQWGFNLISHNSILNGAASTQQFSPPAFSPLQFTNGNFNDSSSVNFSNLLNLFAYRSDINMGATIEALQQNDLLQILAEPNLIAMDGKEASFLAGGSFPFPVLTTTPTGGGTAPVITVQFKPYGVQLNFTPTITQNGSIDLKVAPEVSSLDFTNAVTLDGFQIPALTQKRADTEVTLRDGQSFVIAGLIDDQVSQTIAKVPWLGDIPVLGALFKSRLTNKTSTELLVVVTPHLTTPLPVGEKVDQPVWAVPFMKSTAEEQAIKDAIAKAKADKKKKKDDKDPVFVGPRGHQEPTPTQTQP